jgi:hypothetical protein
MQLDLDLLADGAARISMSTAPACRLLRPYREMGMMRRRTWPAGALPRAG